MKVLTKCLESLNIINSDVDGMDNLIRDEFTQLPLLGKFFFATPLNLSTTKRIFKYLFNITTKKINHGD